MNSMGIIFSFQYIASKKKKRLTFEEALKQVKAEMGMESWHRAWHSRGYRLLMRAAIEMRGIINYAG